MSDEPNRLQSADTGDVASLRGRVERLERERDELDRALARFTAERDEFPELIARLLESEPTGPGFYARLLDEAIAFVPGAQAGSITLRGDDDLYRFAAARGYDLDALRGVSFSEREVHFMSGTGAPSYLIEGIHDLNLRERSDDERTRTLEAHGALRDIAVTLMVPIREGERVVATLLLDNFDRADAFGPFARRSAEILGIVLQVVLRQFRFRRRIRESEERFVRLFMGSPAPTLVLDRESGEVIDANVALASLLGRTRDELLESRAREMFAADGYRKRLEPRLASGTDGTPVELRLRGVHGRAPACLASAEPVAFGGRDAAVVTLVDVSQERRSREELADALEAVLGDTDWFTRAFLEKLAEVRAERAAAAAADDPRRRPRRPSSEDLTPREREVLQLVAAGWPNGAIARELELSLTTIRNYVGRIYPKLGVHSRAEAVVWARERGLIDGRDPPEPTGSS